MVAFAFWDNQYKVKDGDMNILFYVFIVSVAK